MTPGVAYLTLIWYKYLGSRRAGATIKYVRLKLMEASELKSAISELSARVEKIRDWL